MARIPFDLKWKPQIESGEYKVETRSGLPARIVCWDRKTKDMEIIALVYDEHIEEDNEDIAEVALNGKMFPRGKNHDYDLFIVTPEEELTEFEKAIKEMMRSYVKTPDEVIKKTAAKLLDLATKEIGHKWTIRQESYQDGYINGLHDGKAEALKDFPRWRKFEPSIDSPNSELEISKELANSVMRVDNMGCIWLLKREELTNLPKED